MDLTRRATRLIFALAVLPATILAQDAPTPSTVPVYDNLGDHHYEITTRDARAQVYFDQGLRLYYAFNHQEAIRGFRVAQHLDPECAMCWWGEAMAWGPNINLAMDTPSAEAAFAAAERAVALRAHASERERGLIDAVAVRYTVDAPEDRAHLDRAYAQAMGALGDRYPDDPEIAVLRAEAVMDLRPWDYWTESGQPQPGMAEALATLEGVLRDSPRHPGACHFYIHAVEKVYPERAVACAERLAALMPGAGHIVHMPGHIYIRVGRYHEALEANMHAVHEDETYIRDQQPGVGMYTAGYYPHNYDFMAFAAMMIGRGDVAIDAAEKVTALLPAELFGAPGMDFLQHWSVRPLVFRVRMAEWDEILATPAPGSGQPHATAIWHYARGRALAAKGDADGARRELAGLRSMLRDPGIQGLRMEFNASADILAIAEHVLLGWTAAAEADWDQAETALREAVELEDGLLYGEPPEWTVPARQDLGAVLLRAGRTAAAETAFRADLDRFPSNGWSLLGLAVSLEQQGRDREAAAVRGELEEVWATADPSVRRLTRP